MASVFLTKTALMAGLIIMVSMPILSLLNIVETAVYSINVLVPAYVGFVIVLVAVTKIFRKRRSFFQMSFLGASVLAVLAAVDMVYDPALTELSAVRGTIFFLLIVAFVSFLILIAFKSLSNKRRVYQSFSLVLFNLGAFGIVVKHLVAPGLNCYACPWASAGCPIGLLQNWIIMGEVPYYLIGSSMAVFTLFGRAFCGWACPFGFLHDIMDTITSIRFGRKDINKLLRVKSNDPWKDRAGVLSYLTRSIVLIVLIVAAWNYSATWFCKLCPAGFIEAALPYRLSHTVTPDPLYVFRVVIFFSLMMITLIISRFWCRYFCPLGHLAGHFNRVSMLRLELDEEKCNNCGLCGKACPMDLKPDFFLKKEREPDSDVFTKVKNMIKKERSNCILCGECVEKCHHDALKLTFLPSAATGSIKMAQNIRDKFLGEIESSGNKLIKNVQSELGPKPERASPLSDDDGEAQRWEKGMGRTPYPRRTVQKPGSGAYNWPFPVSIYVIYKSVTEIPKMVDHLKSSPGYSVRFMGIFEDDRYYKFYNSVYNGFIETPIIYVNGQLYLGNLEDSNELLQFVEDVQDTYKDIYIYCNSDNCMEGPNSNLLRNAIGDMLLTRGEQYPLTLFRTESPGALISACLPGTLYALYGKSSHSSKKLSDYIRYKVSEHDEKELDSFANIPMTRIELYMKKDDDLSNELLNIVAKASYHSGGKLRFRITEWDNSIPSMVINGNELPKRYYPTSYNTLLMMIRKYGRM